jgi:N-acetylmuramoyl-L-alanine amidase
MTTMRKAAALTLLVLAVLAAGSAHAIVAPGGPRSVMVPLKDGMVASMTDQGLFLEAAPQRGEGALAFARRLCGDPAHAQTVLQANGGGNNLLAGMRYRVPFDLLSNELQLQVVLALFPQDRGEADGWRHQVRGVGLFQRESLWQLSLWFTGTGENFRAIREYNELMDDDAAQGTVVTVPSELLRPAFRAVLPVPETPYHLDYAKDEQGDYAIYRLRPGEALYSSVVVRFTGRIHAADVNALAAEIAQRSGIKDVTDIAVGYRIKIPLDVLEPEFLPENDPRRLEYEADLRASAQFSNQVKAKGLAGITVIVDAGHGGQDAGASMGGVWESLYVYDIAVRIKKVLETHTAARVFVTTRDGDAYRVTDADVLPFSRRHAVLTTPPYPIADAKVGVNLRWYLANSLYRKALQQAGDPQKVVFLSIHADSLHPSLRGAMAYIPAATKRDDSYGKSGAAYASFKEVQESPRATFPMEQRVESEGLSRELAKEIVAALHEGGLPVHPFSPVRDRVIRNHSEWVPAVLRYNQVPAKMLLEVCNLANEEDRRLVQTRAYRQKVSEAIVRGLLAYYGEAVPDAPASPTTRAAK